MIIALDYDDTVSRDPWFWAHFIDIAQGNNHIVHIVTARDPNWRDGTSDIEDWIHHADFPSSGYDRPRIYATNYQPKRQYMQDQGIMIDVWIDDMPESITVGVKRLEALN